MIGKNTLTRIVIVTAIVAVVSLGIAALIGFTTGGYDPRQAAGAGRSVDERKSLALDAIELLSISSVAEDVRIVEGSSGSVEAWLHGSVGGGSRDSVPRLEATRNGSTAEIRLETGPAVRHRPVLEQPRAGGERPEGLCEEALREIGFREHRRGRPPVRGPRPAHHLR